MKKILLGLTFIFAIAGASSVKAQTMINPVQWYTNNSAVSRNVFNGMVANSTRRRGNSAVKTKTVNARNANSARIRPANDTTTFQRSQTTILPQMLAEKTAKSAGEQRQIEQVFAGLLKIYEQTARGDGQSPDDLTYAFEYFVVNNYNIYNDLIEGGFAPRRGVERLTRTQEIAVYNQFKPMLMSNEDVSKLSSRQKQELTELLAIMTGVNYMTYMNAVKNRDDATAGKVRQAAREGLEKLIGARLDSVRITENGVEL